MDPVLELDKKPDDARPKPSPAEDAGNVPASFPAPQTAGNQAMQSLLAPGPSSSVDPDAAAKQFQLDGELDRDYWAIRHLLDLTFYTNAVEDQVIGILRRWATEPFRTHPSKHPEDAGKSEFFDRLLLRLRTSTKDIGIVSDSITSYYDLMFNHFDRANELRFLRDTYSRLFQASEPIAETKFFGTAKTDFLGSLWEDLKSGAIADRIAYYFIGMLEAGEGLLKGLALLLTDPMKVLEGIGNLPNTVQMLWKNKEKLWNAFASAPPNEQARMIGRIFGEAEILIYTVGAGAGARGATAAPELAAAKEVAVFGGRGGSAAAAMTGGGAITVDLGKLGEGARLTSLMAVSADAASKGHEKAEDLAQDEKASAKKEEPQKEPSKEPPESKPSKPTNAPKRLSGPRFERGGVGYRLEGTAEDFAKIKNSPPGSQVYIDRNAAGKPIYVGITERTSITRLLEHLAKQPGEWLGSASKIEITGEGLLEREARALEQDLIGELKPEFNKELDPFTNKYRTAPNPADVQAAHNARIILDIIQGI